MTKSTYKDIRNEFQFSEPKIGDKVYYSLEDYDTGEDFIYEGVVKDIYLQDIDIGGKNIELKMYKVADGLAMQRNAFYTIEELFKMKERLEFLLNELK